MLKNKCKDESEIDISEWYVPFVPQLREFK